MLALLLSTVGPIVLIGAISYYIIYTILDHKTVHSVQSTVAQVRSNIEQTYNNLNYVSQQLPINDMQTLFASENPVDRYLISQQIYDYLQLVSFTNPEIGLFCFICILRMTSSIKMSCCRPALLQTERCG